MKNGQSMYTPTVNRLPVTVWRVVPSIRRASRSISSYVTRQEYVAAVLAAVTVHPTKDHLDGGNPDTTWLVPTPVAPVIKRMNTSTRGTPDPGVTTPAATSSPGAGATVKFDPPAFDAQRGERVYIDWWV